MSYPGKFIALMGVSGSGKDTVMDALMASDLGLVQINSYTTRPLRENEVNGTDYRHITQEEFDTMKQQGEFLEYAFIHHMYQYGTKKADLVEKLEQGQHVIKTIDIQGLLSIDKEHHDVLEVTKSIFLDIPGEVMIERITRRSKVSEEELNDRLASAINERIVAKEHCTAVIDASGTREEVAAHVYALVAEYIGKEII